MLGLLGDVLGWLVVAGIAAASGWAARQVIRAVGRAPGRNALIHVHEAGAVAIAVRGVIDGPPVVRGPLTGVPCALATASVTAAGELLPVWHRTIAGDLRVRYDHEIRTRPKQVTDRSGTLTVRADRIVVDVPVGRVTGFPTDSGVLDRLSALGLPPAVRGRIDADPGRFAVAEHVLSPGEVVHLTTGPAPSLPPDPPFHLSPGARGFVAAGLGIFTWFLVAVVLFGLACAGSIAFALITGQ
ncbi:hypothetical protein GCM10009557_15330 [Virgisporangium ochraceum]|uniref:Uncharacterized protein n=1 Tax=Virgisporangium ochraceum TaxID=65505 RepID=A0A8J4EHP2_9ACTN|nr:hypothetical protein [Virgisporangium ochraceum]GIJ72402.1 hypothetical protein Voc01_073190 [Virgisporangium ochraceum]